MESQQDRLIRVANPGGGAHERPARTAHPCRGQTAVAVAPGAHLRGTFPGGTRDLDRARGRALPAAHHAQEQVDFAEVMSFPVKPRRGSGALALASSAAASRLNECDYFGPM